MGAGRDRGPERTRGGRRREAPAKLRVVPRECPSPLARNQRVPGRRALLCLWAVSRQEGGGWMVYGMDRARAAAGLGRRIAGDVPIQVCPPPGRRPEGAAGG